MMKIHWIATAIGLGLFCTTAQAQFVARSMTPGGSGTYGVVQSGPLPCGTYDSGTTVNGLGLTAGGEIGWIHGYDCGLNIFTHVDSAYGTLAFPGSVTNGANSRIAVYSGGADPNTLGPPVALVSTIVVNGDTDILNKVDVGPLSLNPSNTTWLMATADHVAGQFPGPMDQVTPIANSWVVGSTLGPGTMDVDDLANNSIAPVQMSAIGFPTNWLLRGTGTPIEPGTAVCFGDGSGAACGCGNEGPAGGGCLNGLGVGAVLSSFGTASVTNANVSLEVSGVRTQPGLFFQADNTIAGGAGITFGDGIQCCGQNVVRVSLELPAGTQPATTSTTITTNSQNYPTTAGTPTITSGINPGDKRCYQYWYRDPGPANPCSGAHPFNLSNAVSVIWGL